MCKTTTMIKRAYLGNNLKKEKLKDVIPNIPTHNRLYNQLLHTATFQVTISKTSFKKINNGQLIMKLKHIV